MIPLTVSERLGDLIIPLDTTVSEPTRNRTEDKRIKNPLLYQAELWAQPYAGLGRTFELVAALADTRTTE